MKRQDVRQGLIGGMGARPQKGDYLRARSAPVTCTYFYACMYSLFKHCQSNSASPIVCQDTYLWYCVSLVPTLNIPPKSRDKTGGRAPKKSIFRPLYLLKSLPTGCRLMQTDHRLGLPKSRPKLFCLGRLIFPKFRFPKF